MMEKRFKCEYCGKLFENTVPHKCIGGYRKHHLKFLPLNPTNKENLRILKSALGVPKNLDIFNLIDYLQTEYGLSVNVHVSADGGWLQWVIASSGPITEDFTCYSKYKEALEASVIEALSYIKLKRDGKE